MAPLNRAVSKPMQRLLLIASLILLTGCGSNFAPSPTSRPVTAANLAGTWTYRPLADSEADVLLELRSDGSYTQTVTLPCNVLTSTGQWGIDGTDLELDGILSDFDDWQTADVASWRIIERDESPTGFAILGGAVDPDQWVVLRWVR